MRVSYMAPLRYPNSERCDERGSCRRPQEVVEQARASVAALLRMKLHAINILLFHDGRKADSMKTSSRCRSVRIGRSIGMRKIEVSAGVDAREQTRLAICGNLVPSHVRQFHTRRQCAHLPQQQAQAAQLRRLRA